jgi:hypothetical protein
MYIPTRLRTVKSGSRFSTVGKPQAPFSAGEGVDDPLARSRRRGRSDKVGIIIAEETCGGNWNAA